MPADHSLTRTIRYAAGDTGVIDVWYPRSEPVGITVALVHGGFWKAEWDGHHLEPLAAALARTGFDVASLEYPRVGMPGGGWPGTVASVLAGLNAVADDTALPDSLVAVGHSAGGHLVTLAGSSSLDETFGVTGIVALAGVVDLALAAAMGLGGGAVRAFMDDADEASWAAADPARLRLTVPTVLLTGNVDEDVPHIVSESYLSSRTPDDAACELRLLLGVGHMDLVDPSHPAYAELLRAVRDLAQ
ncbi:MAG: alpha/beta hydrolase [Nostocoides sp.]